jgi:nitrate reductase gamma subunit
MNTQTMLEFSRGPMFYGALLFFIAGMVYRLVTVISLGWNKDLAKPRGSKGAGVVKSFLRGGIIFPFFPREKAAYAHNPVVYIAGGLFHLSMFVVVILGAAHMLVWKSLIGIGWPTLPLPIVDWMAAVGIIAMIALIINRAIHPVMRLLTGPAEVLNWLFVFLPMITGYMLTHHMFLPYEKLFIIHMMSINVLLIWIPLSRISHFMFYFFSRTIHGVEWGKRNAMP